MKRRHWIKLYDRWFESRSHRFLGFEALHLGPHLLVMAAQSGVQEDGSAWILHGDQPLTVNQIATLARLENERAIRALDELESAGTVVRRTDGAYGFPKFSEYQETAEAARKRGEVGPTSDTKLVPKRREEEEKTREEKTPPKPPGGSAEQRRIDRAKQIFAAYESLRIEALCRRTVDPRGFTPRTQRSMLGLLKHVKALEQCDEATAWVKIEEYGKKAIREASKAEGDIRAKLIGWRKDGREWAVTRYDKLRSIPTAAETAPQPRPEWQDDDDVDRSEPVAPERITELLSGLGGQKRISIDA